MPLLEPKPGVSLPTANDDVRLATRRKREQRKREGAAAPTTARDEAVFGVALYAERELLRMPEVKECLSRAAVYQETLVTPDGRLAHWHALEQLAEDYDGVLGDASRLSQLLGEWDRIMERAASGWRGASLAGSTGRPGTESSMSRPTIILALRSLALRSKARAESNAERADGVRGGGREQITRHHHTQTARAHGAGRGDELAADEASSSGLRVTPAMVEKARRELRKVLGEL